MNTRVLAILGACTLIASANAQSRGSFSTPTTITGVKTEKVGATSYKVTLSENARLRAGGRQYKVLNVIGFYRLDNDDDYSASGSDQFGWKFVSNYTGSGGVAGFRDNSGVGLRGNQNATFRFISEAGYAEAIGYKLKLQDLTSCDVKTAYYQDCLAVPEPTTMLGLLAAAPLLRRRRNK